MTSAITDPSWRLSAAWGAAVARLFTPVDASFLAYFRIAFGAIMLWETWRFIRYDWVGLYFSGNEFYFKYWPFDFVQPWPGDGMYFHLVFMALFAVFILFGLFYRVSAGAFFLMISYLFLLEKAHYLNHLYLVCLLSFLMIFLPANRYFSIDALLRPGLSSTKVPAWSLWLLRFQVAVPMFFGGVAKLNSDWLRGEPLRTWLSERTEFPVLGSWFTNESTVWFMAYSALIIDLCFVIYMLHYRVRVFGFILVLVFHFMNARLFDIGIFPWLMIASTLVLFGPDWPRRVVQDVRLRHSYRLPALLGGFVVGGVTGALLAEDLDWFNAIIGGIGVAVAAYHLDEPFLPRRVDARAKENAGKNGPAHHLDKSVWRLPRPGLTALRKGTLALLGLWVGFQVLVPLRHLAVPGQVHWTEEGHDFSWHMMLRHKDSEGFFLLTDASTGEEWVVDPREHLTSRQASKMASRPEMVLQFAHYLEQRARRDGHSDVEVRGNFVSSLNGRAPQMLIDPGVDLTQVRRPWLGHADWILHLETPLYAGN